MRAVTFERWLMDLSPDIHHPSLWCPSSDCVADININLVPPLRGECWAHGTTERPRPVANHKGYTVAQWAYGKPGWVWVGRSLTRIDSSRSSCDLTQRDLAEECARGSVPSKLRNTSIWQRLWTLKMEVSSSHNLGKWCFMRGRVGEVTKISQALCNTSPPYSEKFFEAQVDGSHLWPQLSDMIPKRNSFS